MINWLLSQFLGWQRRVWIFECLGLGSVMWNIENSADSGGFFKPIGKGLGAIIVNLRVQLNSRKKHADTLKDGKRSRQHTVSNKELPLLAEIPAFCRRNTLFPSRATEVIKASHGDVDDSKKSKKGCNKSPNGGLLPLAINHHDKHGDPNKRHQQRAALPTKDSVPPGKGSEMGVSAVRKLVETLDAYIPEPVRAVDQPFLMPIEDVFSISGRGTVVTGRVERGIVRVGEEVEIVGLKDTVKTTCTGVEMFRKLLDEGRAGENCGVLLRGTKREDVQRGQVLAKPGTIKPHTQFESEVYVLSKEEGGRHTPFFKGYRPQFYFRTTDVTGAIELPEGVEMVMPGDNIKMNVTLIAPIAMEEGLRFAIREGGRTVGAGVVAKIFA